jgi:hypothetical protein
MHPVSVCFCATDDDAVVLAVLHLRRDPRMARSILMAWRPPDQSIVDDAQELGSVVVDPAHRGQHLSSPSSGRCRTTWTTRRRSTPASSATSAGYKMRSYFPNTGLTCLAIFGPAEA